MSQRRAFPRLNERFNIKHLRDDLRLGGIDDADVYEIASSQNRIIITHNWTDFRSLIGTKTDAGVIGVPSEWTDKQTDIKLLAFLRRSTPISLHRKLKTLGAEEAKRLTIRNKNEV